MTKRIDQRTYLLEADMIERVVAKALANGNTGPDMFRWRKIRPKGVQIG